MEVCGPTPNPVKRSRFRENLDTLIPAVLLLIGLSFGLEALQDGMAQRAILNEEERASRQLQELAASSEPSVFLRSRMQALATRLLSRGARGLASIGRWAQDHWQMPITVYLFDGKGLMTAAFPERAPNQWLMRNLFQALRLEAEERLPGHLIDGPSNGEGQGKDSRQIEKKIPFLFGEEMDLATLRASRGAVVDTFAGGKPGSFLWALSSHGGIILFCPQNPDEKSIFANQARSLRGGFHRTGFAHKGDLDFLTGDGRGDPEAGEVLKTLAQEKTYAGVRNGFRWVFLETTSGRLVYGVYRPRPAGPAMGRWAGRILGAVLLAVLLVGACRRDLLAFISLKNLLMVLFTMAGIIPLAGMALGSVDLFQIVSQAMGERIEAAQNEGLQKINDEFDPYLEGLSKEVMALTEAPGDGRDPRVREKILRGLAHRNLLHRLALRDAAGRPLFLFGPRMTVEQEDFQRSMARRAVELQTPGRAAEVEYRGNDVTDRMVRANGMGFEEMLRQVNRFQIIQSGWESLLSFYRVHPDNFGGVAVTEMRMPLNLGLFRYIRQRTRHRLTIQDLGMTVYAFDVHGFRWVVPPPARHEKRLLSLALRSWVSGQAVGTHLRGMNDGGFATSIFFPRLGNLCLISWCQDDLMQERIRTAAIALLKGVLLFLALLIILRQAISLHLVEPLANLEEGARALQDRNFSFRLGTPRDDELGRLFATFDQMMDGSQELQVARRVQEGLISTEFPQVPGYDVGGRLLMASDLGGDILHCLRLEDGRLAVLIGDVSGHGIASALVMAFARAVLFHWSRGTDLRPGSMARDLDQALRRTRRSRDFLGVICAILDPPRHEIRLTVQGHIYPMLITSSGKISWIGDPALPLGVGGSSREMGERAIKLEPGDALLGVTDGLVEARSPQGEQVGYDRLARWAMEARSVTPAEWLDRLLNRETSWVAGAQEDDLTLFLIRRHGGERR